VVEVLTLAAGAEAFPGYCLCRPLGRGSLGEVWLAEGPGDKKVAIKFLRCGSQHVAAAEVRALQSIRQLSHPHLIRIQQIWGDSGYVAVAMDLAEGSLADLFKVYYDECGGPMPAPHLCHFLAQAASAIDFLNTRQHLLNGQRLAVRHCDVKPSNLLVQGGIVKLADFSLSVLTSSQMSYCRRAGTLEFSAPEVFQGRLSDRTDQYALAVSYCLLRGGCLPFADTPSRFRNDYLRPAPDLQMLSAAERPILARALDPVPQNRWPTCAELMKELSMAVIGEASVATS
jgi:serine/threonine protein kinase